MTRQLHLQKVTIGIMEEPFPSHTQTQQHGAVKLHRRAASVDSAHAQPSLPDIPHAKDDSFHHNVFVTGTNSAEVAVKGRSLLSFLQEVWVFGQCWLAARLFEITGIDKSTTPRIDTVRREAWRQSSSFKSVTENSALLHFEQQSSRDFGALQSCETDDDREDLEANRKFGGKKETMLEQELRKATSATARARQQNVEIENMFKDMMIDIIGGLQPGVKSQTMCREADGFRPGTDTLKQLGICAIQALKQQLEYSDSLAANVHRLTKELGCTRTEKPMLLTQLKKENDALIRQVSEQKSTLQALEEGKDHCVQVEKELASVCCTLSVKKSELENSHANSLFLAALYRNLQKETAELETENSILREKLNITSAKATHSSSSSLKERRQSYLFVLCVDLSDGIGSVLSTAKLAYKNVLTGIAEHNRHAKVAVVVHGCRGSHHTYVHPTEAPNLNLLGLLDRLPSGGPYDYTRCLSSAYNVVINDTSSHKTVVVIGQSLYNTPRQSLGELCRLFRNEKVPVNTVAMACPSKSEWVDEGDKIHWIAEQTGGCKMYEGSYMTAMSNIIRKE
ncbi:hypothetical protein HD806DRAFT_549097 [Xylariaceae sp. AK1471]|nr:hypothetical protein HD806DRAFT_549097 [Xylariaceae sp. AK1471]